MTNLEYTATKISFGKITADEIKSIVDSLLKDGIYSDEFIDIIDSNPASLDEVLPPFIAYLQRLEISIPTKNDAVWQVIAHHLNRISSGETEPIEGLQKLISDVFWEYDFQANSTKYFGDSHGIERLIGLNWECEDLLERSYPPPQKEADNLKKEIFKQSEEWLKRFANKGTNGNPAPPVGRP